MRIVAGKARGTKLHALEGLDTRPTTDKVKEAIFNMIGARLDELVVLDLFAGSGALGLEAVSRSAVRAVFVESSPEARRIIDTNIRLCHFESVCEIIGSDVVQYLSGKAKGTYDLIFMDPPYFSGLNEKSLELISAKNLLDPDGLIICEHDASESMPVRIGNLTCVKVKQYGRVAVSFYHMA